MRHLASSPPAVRLPPPALPAPPYLPGSGRDAADGGPGIPSACRDGLRRQTRTPGTLSCANRRRTPVRRGDRLPPVHVCTSLPRLNIPWLVDSTSRLALRPAPGTPSPLLSDGVLRHQSKGRSPRARGRHPEPLRPPRPDLRGPCATQSSRGRPTHQSGQRLGSVRSPRRRRCFTALLEHNSRHGLRIARSDTSPARYPTTSGPRRIAATIFRRGRTANLMKPGYVPRVVIVPSKSKSARSIGLPPACPPVARA